MLPHGRPVLIRAQGQGFKLGTRYPLATNYSMDSVTLKLMTCTPLIRQGFDLLHTVQRDRQYERFSPSTCNQRRRFGETRDLISNNLT